MYVCVIVILEIQTLYCNENLPSSIKRYCSTLYFLSKDWADSKWRSVLKGDCDPFF